MNFNLYSASRIPDDPLQIHAQDEDAEVDEHELEFSLHDDPSDVTLSTIEQQSYHGFPRISLLPIA